MHSFFADYPDQNTLKHNFKEQLAAFEIQKQELKNDKIEEVIT